jgi:UDP-N-acetylmuramoyl-L-alanyl-D-glutamate--2,6-diaminopimelate ligase
MLAGIAQLDNAKVSVEIDRAKAIGRLIHEARAGDIILLAGKGHEDYQDVNGVKIPFSDVQQAEIALAARALLRSRSL